MAFYSVHAAPLSGIISGAIKMLSCHCDCVYIVQRTSDQHCQHWLYDAALRELRLISELFGVATVYRAVDSVLKAVGKLPERPCVRTASSLWRSLIVMYWALSDAMTVNWNRRNSRYIHPPTVFHGWALNWYPTNRHWVDLAVCIAIKY